MYTVNTVQEGKTLYKLHSRLGSELLGNPEDIKILERRR